MRLLLAEDDAILSDALLAQLGAAGFVVEHAPNGAVAEYLLLREAFDAAVLDIGLPMVDGLTVLKRVREARPALPVLVLTALDGLDDRVAGLKAGADDYLTKPFDFAELEARLQALLRRSRVGQHGGAGAAGGGAAGSQPQPEIGRLVFDRDARRASVDGTMLELSPREWDLLDLLLTQRNRVVQKEQINQAWLAADRQAQSPSAAAADPVEAPREAPGGAGMIEVYIHRLRRKLEGSGLAIRTVRGLGYLLERDGGHGA